MNVDILTVIALVAAIVLFLRLRSVLGRRTGSERPPFDPFTRREAPRGATPGTDKVVSLPRRPVEREEAKPEVETAETDEKIRTLAPAGSMLNEGLKAIATADRSFSLAEKIPRSADRSTGRADKRRMYSETGRPPKASLNWLMEYKGEVGSRSTPPKSYHRIPFAL